jgi:hypothetical protein
MLEHIVGQLRVVGRHGEWVHAGDREEVVKAQHPVAVGGAGAR